MKATTLHNKLIKFMEANDFYTEQACESSTVFGWKDYLVDFRYADGDEEIEIYIAAWDDEGQLEYLDGDRFQTLAEVKTYITEWFDDNVTIWVGCNGTTSIERNF